MWCLVGLGLSGGIGGLLGLILNGLLSASHEGTLEHVIPIDITECTRLVCAQWCVASWWIFSWGGLGWPVSRGIIGRVRLLTSSLRLVIALVAGPIVSSFPLLIVGGRMVGTVLLCEHLPNGAGGAGTGA